MPMALALSRTTTTMTVVWQRTWRSSGVVRVVEFSGFASDSQDEMSELVLVHLLSWPVAFPEPA